MKVLCSARFGFGEQYRVTGVGAMADELDELRWKVAASCRILGMQGLVRESTGHVSARIPGTDEMFVRCRGGDERGLMFTDVDNVRRVDFDGEGPGMGDRHARPNETPIHGEIYRAYPEVQAVVHAHPYYDNHAADVEAKKRWIIENSGPAAGWLGQLDACIVGDTSDRLSAIRVPTIVTASDLDILAHPHHAQEIHERIAGSEIVILKGNGHVALIEDPDTFADICLSFLRKHEPQLVAK